MLVMQQRICYELASKLDHFTKALLMPDVYHVMQGLLSASTFAHAGLLNKGFTNVRLMDYWITNKILMYD